MTQQAHSRHYFLKFGPCNGVDERLEMRDVNFERIGHCSLHDQEAITVLLGKMGSQQDILACILLMPFGKITPLDV